MPDNMEITTYNASRQIRRENLNQMTFLDELMLIMKELTEPIWCIKLNLNIVGFAHRMGSRQTDKAADTGTGNIYSMGRPR